MGLFKSVLPAIVVDGLNSEIVMNRCEIKGNKEKDTSKIKYKNYLIIFLFLSVGIILKNADGIIKDSKIHNLRLGGIHILAEEINRVKIMNCKVKKKNIVIQLRNLLISLTKA